MSAIDALLTRRSVSAKNLVAPGPTEAELELILRAATRVPDHGKLCPWRLVVLTEAGQQALGAIAHARYASLYSDATPAQLEQETKRFARAPLVIAVLSTPIANKKPVWEQELSAGAVCMNILHAAHMLGLGANWLTEWVAFDEVIRDALLHSSPLAGEARWGGVQQAPQSIATPPHPTPLPQGERELARIAGFIYIGSKIENPEDRPRPALTDIVSFYAE